MAALLLEHCLLDTRKAGGRSLLALRTRSSAYRRSKQTSVIEEFGAVGVSPYLNEHFYYRSTRIDRQVVVKFSKVDLTLSYTGFSSNHLTWVRCELDAISNLLLFSSRVSRGQLARLFLLTAGTTSEAEETRRRRGFKKY